MYSRSSIGLVSQEEVRATESTKNTLSMLVSDYRSTGGIHMPVAEVVYQAPDLSDEQFVEAVCGLRPCRTGGVRLEIDQLGTKKIVHNYGHGGCGITLSLGCAQVACDLVESIDSKQSEVAVIGAGVIGLTSALELVKRGYKVRMYAEQSGLETTSAIAGALWLPVGIDFGETDEQVARMHDLLLRSKNEFEKLDPTRFGIEHLTVYEPANSKTEEYLFNNGSIEPQVAIESFPFPCKADAGKKFTTLFIQNTRFLTTLLEDFSALGGEFVARRFEHATDIESLEESIIVNCTGLGAKSLFEDDRMFAARGVLVHMKPQDLGYGVHDGFKYMFPRENALILGGCFQEDSWSDAPDQEMIDEILVHHRRFFGQS